MRSTGGVVVVTIATSGTWVPVALPTEPIRRSDVEQYARPDQVCPVCERTWPQPCETLDCGTFDVDDLGPVYVYTQPATAQPASTQFKRTEQPT
jgi:hypothetical protein